jgi:hypothetical protein
MSNRELLKRLIICLCILLNSLVLIGCITSTTRALWEKKLEHVRTERKSAYSNQIYISTNKADKNLFIPVYYKQTVENRTGQTDNTLPSIYVKLKSWRESDFHIFKKLLNDQDNLKLNTINIDHSVDESDYRIRVKLYYNNDVIFSRYAKNELRKLKDTKSNKVLSFSHGAYFEMIDIKGLSSLSLNLEPISPFLTGDYTFAVHFDEYNARYYDNPLPVRIVITPFALIADALFSVSILFGNVPK